MKKNLLIIFLALLFCNHGFAETYYFKKCDLNEKHFADYFIDVDNKVINVSFLIKKDGSTQEWKDKIDVIKKDKVGSEKLQSRRGKDYYYQYYLDAKSKSVTRQNYKKVNSFFVLYGPPVKSYCEDVKADWRKDSGDLTDEEKIQQLEAEKEKKLVEEKKKQKELTLKEEEKRKKLIEEKKNEEIKDIHKILVIADKWIKLSKYNSSSAENLENDFDKKAKEVCENKNFVIIKKKVEIVEMDDTPAYGTETVIKLGVDGTVECKS
tara:strand:+ start:48 stop:842 length:795 start_codon:yes stop_codon:yes gene_type:complete